MGYGTNNPQRVIVESPEGTGLRQDVDKLTTDLAEKANQVNSLNWLNLSQAPYNTDKTGVVDCTTTINNAITNSGSTSVIYLPLGTYLISSTILIPSNVFFVCEGTLKYTGNGNAVEFRGQYSTVRINKILSTSTTSNGITYNPITTMVAYNELFINHIETTGYGVYLDASTYTNGIQHNKIKFNHMWNQQYGIFITCSKGWIGENVFDCGRIGIDNKHSTIAIYIQDLNGGNAITGTKLYHPALEGTNEGIVIQSGGSCEIIDIRAEESIDSNVIRIIGNPKVTISSETVYINKIDLTACTGTHVKIRGTILASDGSPIATELRSNNANKRIKLLYKGYVNCTVATYNVTDDKPAYYLWTTGATIVNLNQYYGDYGIEEFVVNFFQGAQINDSTGTMIFDGTNAKGKTYLFKRVNQSSVGLNGWISELISSPTAKNTLIYNGDGVATTVNIPHGLGVIPTYYEVKPVSLDAGNAGIKYCTADATNIKVYFNTAPIVGTNNVSLNWKAEL